MQPTEEKLIAAQQTLSLARRQWLAGATLGGLVAGAGVAGYTVGRRENAAPPASAANTDSTLQQQPFYGPHQAGILTPQPASALVAVFDVLAQDRAGLERLFKLLTERIAFLMQGGAIAQPANPRLPPPNSGLMGARAYPDNLTITVGVGASLFDARYGLTAHKPRHLIEMLRFSNDALDPRQCHGDLSLQLCANTAETTIHALRDVIKHTPDLLAIRWQMEGSLPAHALQQGQTPRNLLGFIDGTASNGDADAALQREVLWVSDHANSDGEPAWTRGGSYQVIRLIRNRVEFWDRTPLREQERIFGRDKLSGAPLGKSHEREDPDYANDASGERIPHSAHIRLANPRTPETRKHLILRRGYNYSRGISKAGQLDMGLLFVCYQSNLSNGFITVQSRLNGEPLEEYIQPFGGGYFFALPGVRDQTGWLGQALLAA